MDIRSSDEEALREALLSLERARVQEKIARQKMEALVAGLQILNECDSVAEMYEQIIGCLRGLLPFDEAAILTDAGHGHLTTAIATHDALKFARLPVHGAFKRCLAGRATVLTQLDKVAEWPINDGPFASGSAVMVALPGLKQKMLMVCVNRTGGALKRADVRVLESFSPMASQAVTRARELESLNTLVYALDHRAYFDLLTGLPNRASFERRLHHCVNDANAAFAILFIDLDNFKTINDTFGHSAGDILLSEVGFRMSSCVRSEDTVARLGGDEFAMIIRSVIDIDDIKELSKRLLQVLARPIHLRKTRLTPSASIGITMCEDNSILPQRLMQNADIALYEAKRAGRDCFRFFSKGMQDAVDIDFEIESNLKQAIEQEKFSLVYQPIISSRTMACNKLEVLVRWGNPRGPLFRPDQFIPIAERTGAIRELGAWILRQAIEESSDWLKESVEHRLSINISASELQDSALCAQLAETITSAGIPFHQIEFELSERIIARDLDQQVLSNIETITNAGMALSFDDFGTGESSLLHLQRFPGSSLKIDKSFIDDVVTSEKQRNLVTGLIHFSHHLGMEVVAEGVEGGEQAKFLISAGCDLLQGYFFAMPLPFSQTIIQPDAWRRNLEELTNANVRSLVSYPRIVNG